jgi:deoxyribose-phosphate aldolase
LYQKVPQRYDILICFLICLIFFVNLQKKYSIKKEQIMKPNKKASEMSMQELAAYIDHSVLKPEFSQDEIRNCISDGIIFGCKTVCINPSALNIARELCKGTQTGICVVCDFPFGLSTTASKIKQADIICKEGDVEDLDVVSNYGWIRSGKWKEVETEFKEIANLAHSYGTILKIIFETDALTKEEVIRATDIACNVGVDFVKTSTGFFTGGANNGATPEIISWMMEAANGRCKVKGSGGIRDQASFFHLIDMGIDRMGIGYRSTSVVLGVSLADIKNEHY